MVSTPGSATATADDNDDLSEESSDSGDEASPGQKRKRQKLRHRSSSPGSVNAGSSVADAQSINSGTWTVENVSYCVFCLIDRLIGWLID